MLLTDYLLQKCVPDDGCRENEASQEMSNVESTVDMTWVLVNLDPQVQGATVENSERKKWNFNNTSLLINLLLILQLKSQLALICQKSVV